MVGRWRSGALLELTPLEDNPWLGADPMRNNDFRYAGDPFQRACPYAAHIRKANPRDDPPGGMAETLTHRIIRRSIPFGPEVQPGETVTRHSRGLLFVCYQASIERQFEFIQSRYSNNPILSPARSGPTPARRSSLASIRSSDKTAKAADDSWMSPLQIIPTGIDGQRSKYRKNSSC